MGRNASYSTLAVFLSDLEYSLQGNKKIIEGESYPDRNAQFEYNQTRNEGWVNVGIDHYTSAFAVESIRQWWNSRGQKVYLEAEVMNTESDYGK